MLCVRRGGSSEVDPDHDQMDRDPPKNVGCESVAFFFSTFVIFIDGNLDVYARGYYEGN